MKTLSKVLAFFLACSSLCAFAGETITSPKLPQDGGQATACLESLLASRLQPGQKFFSFTGAFIKTDGHGNADITTAQYVATTDTPIVQFTYNFTTPESTGWRYYSYMDGSVEKIGFYSESVSRLVQVNEAPKSGPSLDYTIDVSPCEQLLQNGQ